MSEPRKFDFAQRGACSYSDQVNAAANSRGDGRAAEGVFSEGVDVVEWPNFDSSGPTDCSSGSCAGRSNRFARVDLRRGDISSYLRYFLTQAMEFKFKEQYQRIFVCRREEVSSPDSSSLPAAAAGATALTVRFYG